MTTYREIRTGLGTKVVHSSPFKEASTLEFSLVATTENGRDAASLESDTLYPVVESLVVILGPILMVVGTVGNVLAGVVVTKSKVLWSRTTSLYILVLAVSDTLLLLFAMIDYILSFNGVMIREMSMDACRGVWFVLYFLKMWEAWILVNMSLERMVAVLLPHKVKLFFSKTRATVGLLMTTVIIFGINVVYIPMFSIEENNRLCEVTKKFITISYAMRWLDMVLSALLPFLIMTVSSVSITFKIIQSNLQRRQMVQGADIKISRMTMSLLLVAVCFLILTGPMVVMAPYINIYFASKTLKEAYHFMNIFYIFNTIIFLNFVVNFYIYCLTNPVFRQEFRVIFCCKKKLSRDPKMAATLSSALSGTRSGNMAETQRSEQPHRASDHTHI